MRDGVMSSRLACGIAVPRVRWRIEQVLVQLEIEPTPELESGMIGKQFTDWVQKAETVHHGLMQEAGFLAAK